MTFSSRPSSGEYSESDESSDSESEYVPIYPPNEEEEDFYEYAARVNSDDQDIWRLDEEEDEYDMGGDPIHNEEEQRCNYNECEILEDEYEEEETSK